MITPFKLQLNRFRVVPVPKPRELFSRFGAVDASRLSYTGDECVDFSKSKLDTLSDISKDASE